LYAVGRVDFIFDRAQELHLSADELSALTGVKKTTMANKGRVICDLLRLGYFNPELSRRNLLEHSPLRWLVEVDGLIVDARGLPTPLQEEARRRGLIPAAQWSPP
jgi:hypothetical protein